MRNSKERCRRTRHPLWPALMVLTVVVLLAMSVLSLAVYVLADLELQVNGGEQIKLEYGEEFIDQGAMAFLGGAPIELEVTASGDVDPAQLGTYTVTYTAQFGRHTAVAERTVQVVDTRAPTITLVEDPDAFTELGNDYVEEGFSAWDAVDGDLTDSVTRTVADGVITYTVQDSSGNTAQVERTIVYVDKIAPELVLQGDDTVSMYVGAVYTDPGYTATDNADGDITANVTISGTYDTETPGSYTIHYSVADSSGNTAEAERKLIVKDFPTALPADPEDAELTYVDDSYLQGVGMVNDPENPGEKVIYLTFDDGPGAYTPQLLQILEKYNVKVTFFVVGSACLEYLDDIADAGHSIGLHTNTHKYSLLYSSEDAFFADLNAIREKVFERTGIEATLHRFPGGSSNTLSKKYSVGIMTKLTQAVEDAGYRYFDWNVDSNDAGGAGTSVEVYNNVVSGIKGKKTAVVLQHDVKGYSVAAVEKIIQWGLANGYTFLPLDADSPTCHHGVNN